MFDGVDPRQAEKIEILSEQLGQVIRRYYVDELTEVNNHRPNTIKNVKAVFGPWILRSTYDKDILKRLERSDDIRYKKLSMITPKMVKELYHVCGSRSPIVANRLVEYLRKFWNDFVKADDNPFLMDSKKKYEEKEYLDYLDEQELQRVMTNAVKIDDRSGRLLESHYKKYRLNPVSCMAIALLLTTGRRTASEVTCLKWTNYPRSGEKRLVLQQTKTSKKNKS